MKEKEPEFDGISTDWQDYIISFEQVADWNNWNERERAQQLIMCFKGNAQKLLSECTRTDLQNYQRLKNVLGRRFTPVKREVAFRCEFKSRKRERNESAAEFGYALRRLALKAYPHVTYSALESQEIDHFIHGLGHYEMKKTRSISSPFVP